MNNSLILQSRFYLILSFEAFIIHDHRFQIVTFAAKFGVRNIAFLGIGLLLVNYIGAILTAIYMPQVFNRNLMVPVHAIFALCLIFQEASASFYQVIWRLLYAEYIIFPFM
ncbi:hypothetical protein TorRG33x02_217810 [Trema orientale]|uniref:Uncharacterized protein n=1 Tax=Trema orientale TaxID=63057 RepID=A0A2P5EA36_TREOI|nr:hypothetical protein TorRG33x02_217810 [Trema orientale]